MGEEVGPTGGLLLPLSLTLFELPNQRLRRVEDVFEGERLMVSSSAVAPEVLEEFFSFSKACVKVEVDSAVSSVDVGISTSSASRYHFLRRVYRSHPSWPRRPSFHYRIVSFRFSRIQETDLYSLCCHSISTLHRLMIWNPCLIHRHLRYATHCPRSSAIRHFHCCVRRAVQIRPYWEQCSDVHPSMLSAQTGTKSTSTRSRANDAGFHRQ